MRWRSPLPLLLFLLADGSWGQSSGFRICAFNVQNLDTTKMTNTRVAHTLTRLVSRCDICLLQEVKDPQNAAIKVLVKALNSNTSDRYEDAHQYHFVSSKSLGNSDNLQQYVFIYRKNTVNMTGEYQYQTKKKSFVRPPFVVRVQSNRTAIGEFVLVPLHTDPQDAVQEINHLYDVFQEVSKKWKTKNLMFLGDFNAGCAHMTRPDKKKIRLFTEKGFYWLIGDKVDTTVTDRTCPYDRIVVHGDVLLKHIKPYSAKVFNYAKEFRLSKDRVLKVSDHFPVEVMLKASGLLLQATPLHLLLSLSVILWYCVTDHRAFLSLDAKPLC